MNETTSGELALNATTLRIGMIWAEARGRAIGRDGDMPWHLPEDLAHFKHSTIGTPVIMGRRTWESLPERFRPLPGRLNIVVSRDPLFVAEGATVVTSLESALESILVAGDPASNHTTEGVHAWIMGGGQLYRSAMPFASELLVTRIELDIEGADTFAPVISSDWQLVDPGVLETAASGIHYRFQRYLRANVSAT